MNLARPNLESTAESRPGPGVRMVQVAEDRDGQRIDNFLTGQLKGVPKSLIYRILRTGQVRINGKRAKADTRVVAGDQVRIPPVRVGEPHDSGAPPKTQIEQVERAIIFEDRDFLVLDKPSGVASHGGSGVTFGAIELLRAARPGDTLELAHRLDRDTSGVLVLARRRPALTGLQALIRDNATTKQYLALLKGHTHKAKFDVQASLRKSILQGGERMVRVADDGKPSLTRFHIIDIFADASLAEVTLFTGRTHQIRVHAQHIEHPLAGDEKYGERGFNQNMRGVGLKRLFLHAARFEFELDGKSRSFSAPLSPDLAAVLDALPRGVSRKGKLR
ncbi:MAG TPA: RluA family pseudouridine synthase [Rudaea sp.]|jgi:23S rRNA pseudouridine955/2504/2580 synthase|uniref:RluA family pseudouridine synthase n=1 Tax=Rudaea sp. TaxID=2136325 RepID=UPI002F947D97